MTSRTMGPNNPQHPQFQIGREASDWLVRLQDPQPEPDDPYFDPKKRDAAFLEWLQRSPEHVRMFLKIRETYNRLGQIDAKRLIRIQDLLGESQKAVSHVADRVRGRSIAPRPKELEAIRENARSWRGAGAVLRSRPAIGLASLAVAGIVIGLVLMYRRPVTASTILYSTSVGERKFVALEDGSMLTLNTDTRVAVTYESHAREVHLLSGEVLFDVRHNARRPFRVFSDNVSIEDRGTQFDVYRQPTGTTVSVISGQVQLYCDCATRGSASAAQAAAPGERIAISQRALTSVALGHGDRAEVTATPKNAILTRQTVSARELSLSIAWKDGKVWFEGQTLAAAVSELNRYTTRRLIIADPNIATYKVKGQFPVADMEAVVDVLRETLDIRVLPPDPQEPASIRLGK